MNNMYRTTLCLLGIIGATATAAVAQKPADQESKVDAYMLSQVAQKHLAAVSVSVVRDGKLLFAKGYGKSNLETNSAATRDTMFEIGSITKQFTATCIMMLVEDGKISLDDPVSRHFKDAPATWSKVTIRHLLNHDSGIKDYTDIGDVEKMFRDKHTSKELMSLITPLPMDFQPGAKWAYSNTNYYLLGLIVESISGMPLQQFLHDRIFSRVGMAKTCTTNPETVIPNRASGYGWQVDKFRNYDALNQTAAGGAGFIESNVVDMANWAIAVDSGKLLKPTSWNEIFTPVKLNDGSRFQYGFGWMIDSYRGRRHIWHNGGTISHRAMISRFPDDKLTVIVLCNTANGQPEQISRDVAALYVPSMAAYTEKTITDTDPKTTARLKMLLEKMIDATATPELFSEDMRKRLFPDVLKQLSAQVKTLGPINRFQLAKFSSMGTLKSYVYGLTLGTTRLLAYFTIDADDKIAGAMLRPE